MACHSEPIAIPRGRRGVSGQGAVRAVVVDEVLKVGEEAHSITLRDSLAPSCHFPGGVCAISLSFSLILVLG